MLDPFADFSRIAAALGCNYGDDSHAELECMRQISFVQLIETVNNWNATPSLSYSKYIRKYTLVFQISRLELTRIKKPTKSTSLPTRLTDTRKVWSPKVRLLFPTLLLRFLPKATSLDPLATRKPGPATLIGTAFCDSPSVSIRIGIFTQVSVPLSAQT